MVKYAELQNPHGEHQLLMKLLDGDCRCVKASWFSPTLVWIAASTCLLFLLGMFLCIWSGFWMKFGVLPWCLAIFALANYGPEVLSTHGNRTILLEPGKIEIEVGRRRFTTAQHAIAELGAPRVVKMVRAAVRLQRRRDKKAAKEVTNAAKERAAAAAKEADRDRRRALRLAARVAPEADTEHRLEAARAARLMELELLTAAGEGDGGLSLADEGGPGHGKLSFAEGAGHGELSLAARRKAAKDR